MTALSDLLNRLNRNQWSAREIERRTEKLGSKISNGAVSKYLNGTHSGEPSLRVLQAFADVFGTDVNRLREAAGQLPVSERFELPPEADLLDNDERLAVVNLVRVMANKKAGDGDARDTTPMTDDGLGTFGGRARGDLDHENTNDGSGTNVHHLPPPPAGQAAAYRAHNRGKHIDDAYQHLGEETQDTEDNE